jgi:hypothetical protein
MVRDIRNVGLPAAISPAALSANGRSATFDPAVRPVDLKPPVLNIG